MLSLALGCGGSAAVKEMESIANKVCECKDMECIQKVQKEQEEWVAKNGDAFAGSEADAEKMSAATQKMTDCVTKVVEAEAAKAGGE
jgi:hypothetical protein